MRYLFLQIVCRLSNCVCNSKLASDVLDSCKQVKYRGWFFNILAVLLVCFVQSISVQIESVLQLAILLTLITLSNKSFKNLAYVSKVQFFLRISYPNVLTFISVFLPYICIPLL